jgi:hypothetical protein
MVSNKPLTSNNKFKVDFTLGLPSMGLTFSSSANMTRIMDVLLQAADANPDKFGVFTHETMPKRYHFSDKERIAPVYVIPKFGYYLTNHKDGDTGMSKGVSTFIYYGRQD